MVYNRKVDNLFQDWEEQKKITKDGINMKKILSIILCIILIFSFNISIIAADSYDNMNEKKFQKIIEEQNNLVEMEFEKSISANYGSSNSNYNVVPGDSGNPPSVNSTTTFTSMGVMDYGYSYTSGGYAKVSGSLTSKRIYLRADADPLWNDASAWGYIGRDFTYTGTTDKSVYVTIQGDYITSLITSFNPEIASDAGTQVQLSVELWDKTLGTRLANRNFLNESIGFLDYKKFTNTYNESFSITLKPNHIYVAIVRGDLSATARITGSARAYAHPDDGGYIGISQVKITF